MLGVMLVTFVIVQFAPGGPVERLIAQLSGTDVGATANFSGGGSDFAGSNQPGMPGDISAAPVSYTHLTLPVSYTHLTLPTTPYV